MGVHLPFLVRNTDKNEEMGLKGGRHGRCRDCRGRGQPMDGRFAAAHRLTTAPCTTAARLRTAAWKTPAPSAAVSHTAHSAYDYEIDGRKKKER